MIELGNDLVSYCTVLTRDLGDRAIVFNQAILNIASMLKQIIDTAFRPARQCVQMSVMYPRNLSGLCGSTTPNSQSRHRLSLSLMLMNVRTFIMARRCRLGASAAASRRGSPSVNNKRFKPAGISPRKTASRPPAPPENWLQPQPARRERRSVASPNPSEQLPGSPGQYPCLARWMRPQFQP